MVGPIYANYVLFIDPESVLGLPLSIDALLFAFIGGLGSLFGPLLGAVVLVPLTELLRGLLGGRLAGIHLIVYGVILILVMRLAPRGLSGLLLDAMARRPKMSAPLLRVCGVSRWFGGLRAVDEVSFDLNSNEIVGLIGPNGAGKTTLFETISGFIRPTKGTIGFDGLDITGQPPHRLARLGIGRTFQIVQPFRDVSVLENVIAGVVGPDRGSADPPRRGDGGSDPRQT